MYIYIYISVYMCVYTYVCICIYIDIGTCLRIYNTDCTYTYVRVDTRIYIYVYTYTHAWIGISSRASSSNNFRQLLPRRAALSVTSLVFLICFSVCLPSQVLLLMFCSCFNFWCVTVSSHFSIFSSGFLECSVYLRNTWHTKG